MKILVAEDEAAIQKILRLYLEKEGYQVSVVSNGLMALEALCAEPFDLLLADWMMPQMDGLTLCKEVRRCGIPVKIIMLTAKSETQNEYDGLSCGADDYLRKPFDPPILMLRISKMLRVDEELRCGAVTLYPQTHCAFVGQEELRLTQKEYLLLQAFLLNKGITLSRESLLNRVWGMDYEGDDRTLDTHVRRLRSKLKLPYITTQIGLGYRMEEPDA